MAYSHSLADRIRTLLGRRRGLTEKTLFGGIGFLLDGNMLVGVWQTSLIARVGPDASDQSLKLPHARQFDITGRPMKGWIMVEADGLDDDVALRAWIDRALDFVRTLPAKATA
jgi:TfoX/Sxy family transcriptional regulator of competence genes